MEIDVSILSRMKHTRFIIDIPYVGPHCLIFLLDVALLIPDSSARCPCHLFFSKVLFTTDFSHIHQ